MQTPIAIRCDDTSATTTPVATPTASSNTRSAACIRRSETPHYKSASKVLVSDCKLDPLKTTKHVMHSGGGGGAIVPTYDLELNVHQIGNITFVAPQCRHDHPLFLRETKTRMCKLGDKCLVYQMRGAILDTNDRPVYTAFKWTDKTRGLPRFSDDGLCVVCFQARLDVDSLV